MRRRQTQPAVPLSHTQHLPTYNPFFFFFFRVRVFSTNYRRTQLSAQGFLEGFLGGKGGVPVVVRPRAEDFLNQWESRGHEMYEVCPFGGLDCRVWFVVLWSFVVEKALFAPSLHVSFI